MSEWLEDRESVHEARALRKAVTYRVLDWNENFRNEDPEVYDKVLRHLAVLLDCADPEFMFYAGSHLPHMGDNILRGVEQHVLNGLKALTGPHGYTVYRMLLLKKNELQES